MAGRILEGGCDKLCMFVVVWSSLLSRNVVGLPPDKSSRSRAEHCFCGSASIWVGIAEVGGAGMIRLRVGGAEMSETK